MRGNVLRGYFQTIHSEFHAQIEKKIILIYSWKNIFHEKQPDQIIWNLLRIEEWMNFQHTLRKPQEKIESSD